MHPETLRLYEAARQRGLRPTDWPMRSMAGPHHFHVTQTVYRGALTIARHEAAASDKQWLAFPTTARLPSKSMVLTIAGPPRPTCVLLHETGDGRVGISIASEIAVVPLVAFTPGQEGCQDFPVEEMSLAQKCFREQFSEHELGKIAWETAFILSLINTPRKVDITPASGLDWTRQHRKAVERVTGSAAMAFSVVSWELGRRCKAVGNEISTEGHPKALHWCRAHWREAEKGQPKAEWVNLPFKGGWGWYCWVPDCWKGHPDYGVKLQRHQPRMPGEKPERLQASGQAVLDRTRWEAMSAAHRAAMVEAGYAPTTAVH